MKRVCFDFSDESYEKLEALQRLLGHENKAGVIKDGLGLLSDAIDAIQNDAKVIRHNSDGTSQELHLPTLAS